MSSIPLLGSGSERDGRKSPFTFVNDFCNAAIFDVNSTSYEGICLMVNASTEEERDVLTRGWRDHKLEELNFIGTVGALLSACLASAGSWPDILNNGRDRPWTVKAGLYGGLIFALFTVLVAAQQSMRLHRLSGHRDGLKNIRDSLARTVGPDGYRPYRFQVYAWGASVFFLVAAVVCMIASITVLVWTSAAYGPNKKPEDGWWDGDAKMAVTFTVILGVSALGFLGSQSALAGTRPATR